MILGSGPWPSGCCGTRLGSGEVGVTPARKERWIRSWRRGRCNVKHGSCVCWETGVVYRQPAVPEREAVVYWLVRYKTLGLGCGLARATASGRTVDTLELLLRVDDFGCTEWGKIGVTYAYRHRILWSTLCACSSRLSVSRKSAHLLYISHESVGVTLAFFFLFIRSFESPHLSSSRSFLCLSVSTLHPSVVLLIQN